MLIFSCLLTSKWHQQIRPSKQDFSLVTDYRPCQELNFNIKILTILWFRYNPADKHVNFTKWNKKKKWNWQQYYKNYNELFSTFDAVLRKESGSKPQCLLSEEILWNAINNKQKFLCANKKKIIFCLRFRELFNVIDGIKAA